MNKRSIKSLLNSSLDQVRLAMGDLNNRMGSIRKLINTKADLADLNALKLALVKDIQAATETAAGTEHLRCLTCGQPRYAVSQSIDDPMIQRQVSQQTISSRVTGLDGNGNTCFVYGEHGELYLGRSATGKPVLSKPSQNTESHPHHRSSMNPSPPSPDK